MSLFLSYFIVSPSEELSEQRLRHNNPAYEDPINTRVYEEIKELQFPSPQLFYRFSVRRTQRTTSETQQSSI